MSEYIIRVDEDYERWHYVEQQYTHFFGYPITDEIVRCKDCVRYKPYRTDRHGMMKRCHDEHGHTHKRDENDFCSRGEMRSE